MDRSPSAIRCDNASAPDRASECWDTRTIRSDLARSTSSWARRCSSRAAASETFSFSQAARARESPSPRRAASPSASAIRASSAAISDSRESISTPASRTIRRSCSDCPRSPSHSASRRAASSFRRPCSSRRSDRSRSRSASVTRASSRPTSIRARSERAARSASSMPPNASRAESNARVIARRFREATRRSRSFSSDRNALYRSAFRTCRSSAPICRRTSSRMSFTRARFWRVLSIFRSASFRRTRNLATPAASSTIMRISSGRASTISPTFPWAMMAYPRAPAPVSRNSSAMSFSRHGTLLMENSLSPSRKVRRVIAISAYDSYPGGAFPSSFTKVRVTSAIPRGPAASEPAKMTSSSALLRR